MFVKPEAITMQLTGVHDSATGKAAAQALRQIAGVRSVSVDRHRATAAVTFSPDRTTVSELTRALADAGFYVI